MSRWRTGDGIFLLATPLLLSTAVLVVAPAVVSLGLAFTEYDALSAPRFTGLANFRTLWHDPLFWTALRNSGYIAVLSVPLRLALALALALLTPPRPRPCRSYRRLPSVGHPDTRTHLWSAA